MVESMNIVGTQTNKSLFNIILCHSAFILLYDVRIRTAQVIKHQGVVPVEELPENSTVGIASTPHPDVFLQTQIFHLMLHSENRTKSVHNQHPINSTDGVPFVTLSIILSVFLLHFCCIFILPCVSIIYQLCLRNLSMAHEAPTPLVEAIIARHCMQNSCFY